MLIAQLHNKNTTQILQMINLEKMPPDWKFAQQHAKAVKPGVVEDIHKTSAKNMFCPCCLKPIMKEEISLSENSKELEFLGFGFPLYFIFVKYCMVLLLVLICSYSSMSLYWAISENYELCSHRRLAGGTGPLCTSFMIRIARVEAEVSIAEIILRITSFVLHLFTLIYIRDNIKKTLEYYDEKTTSLSDYSLLFKNLPLKKGIQSDIKNFVNFQFKDKWEQLKQSYLSKQFQSDKKVMQITLLPDLTNFYTLEGEKKALIEQKRLLLSAQQRDRQAINQISSQIKTKQSQMKKICQEDKNLASKDQLKSQVAIVTLNSEVFKQHIKDYGEENQLNAEELMEYFGIFDGSIKIKEAPEPNEIIWEYVNYPIEKRLGRRVIGWLLTVAFLAVVTVCFYFLLLAKTNNLLTALKQRDEGLQDASDRHFTIAVALVYIALVLIVLFNKLLMGFVLHEFTHLEKHDNTSSEEFSFALKYTLGLFFTTALMTLAVEAITFDNFYAHEYGVIEEENIMFFINAFFVPIIWLVNPWQIFILLKRRYYFGKQNLTQAQANQIMSDCPYTIGKRYAQIIETMWFTFLYATLIPVGAFIAIVGLAFYYWVDKYNLLRRSSLRHNLSGHMTLVSMKLLDMTLILMPLGEIVFDAYIRDGVNASTIVFTCIGFLYLVIPIDKILDFVHDEKFKPEERSYEDVKDTFLETYQTLHPTLSFKASKILQRMKSKTSKQYSMNELQEMDFHDQVKEKGSKMQLNINDTMGEGDEEKAIDEDLEITLKFAPSSAELINADSVNVAGDQGAAIKPTSSEEEN